MASISGLREQIKANAVHLFPSIVGPHITQHSGSNTYLYIPPSTAFDIALVNVTISRVSRISDETPESYLGYQAYLTYQTPAGCKRAAQGEAAESVEGALESLLRTTGRALAGNMMDVFKGEGFGNWREYGGGFVDEEVSVRGQASEFGLEGAV
ncbi:hypothetical protein LTR36_003651 [Oleoguttula mirabilis]|uniref:Uncharacterized protein n=1 Tax=Oleoguttula mirabilis TaxID=1507867 RepID=A0AAV9JIP9_9PEZI|nr:hypothetical protein LTR36_003651 [Oleoguttula mirabilis]